MKRIFPLFLILVLLITCLPLTVLAVDYNGHDFPDINTVWTDKETYTEAIIECGSDYVELYLLGEEFKYWSDTGMITVSGNSCCWQRFDYSSSTNSWSLDASGSNSALSIYFNYCVWATFDIYDGDGNLYLAGDSSADFTEPTEPESSGTILSITVDCDDSADIYPGDTVQFWANVNGNGTYDTSVTWSFATGGTDSTTTLDQNGLLTIGEYETSLYLAVTATSVADPTISGTRTIKLNLSGSSDSTESTESPEATTGGSGTDYSDQFEDVNQNLEDVETAVGEVGDAVGAVGDKVDDLISGGEAGSDLSDKSGELSEDIGAIQDFEQEQMDILDENWSELKDSIDFSGFIPALEFVSGYINKAWARLDTFQVIFFLPLFLGIFFFICNRAPYATVPRSKDKIRHGQLKGQQRWF